ncbi:iron chelate uptake ABC transporter family permease subunit [uncultured Propionibacterium sp.]|uniref:FecCD family ABC transporter permease n=1 Tax=uncultured Propionibacterium sp. TaxID=218066 RepID=UPI00292F9771|nr:iron chelate uptake ABC transporter family permease subunit [uncultured Propionibacterium sp.]
MSTPAGRSGRADIWHDGSAVPSLPVPGGRLPVRPRALVVTAGLVVAALVVAVLAVATGSYDLDPAGVVHVLRGAGSQTDRFIVLQQRLPRAAAAWLAGAGLGLSGAVFQSLSRNPLGSPDIVGFTTGASAGGLVIIVLMGAPGIASLALGTTIGGFLTAALVVMVTIRRGIAGENLVLAGIAVAAMISAVDEYLISRAPLESAEAAKAWRFGSLNTIGWAQAGALAIAMAVLLPQLVWLARPARILELGDDSAAGLGVRPARQRLVMLVHGVLLVAVVVAVTGPIGFLALAAPQLARRLAGSPGIAFWPTVVMGGALLGAADLLAQRVLAPFQIPVGLVSSAIGGLYLLWLLGFSRRDA